MRKFLTKLSIFMVPLIIFVTLTERFCRLNTTFALKKSQIEANKDSVEVLILGSSHLQNAINPDFLKFRASNLAFGGQPIEMDYYLLEKYLPKLPRLKVLILEISPHSFYSHFDSSNWNGHIYANLYDIYHGVEKTSLKNHFFLLSNFKFFSGLYMDNINPLSYKYIVNKYGFIVNDYNDRFSKLNYDKGQIASTFIMDHEFHDSKFLNSNFNYLRKALLLASSRGVNIILITPPLYHTYTAKVPQYVNSNVKHILDKLKQQADFKYYDFSKNVEFRVTDFKNDNHLNSTGAIKFTKELESLIQNDL